MLLIYSHIITARCVYVFDWIFGQWGIKYMVTNNIQEFTDSGLPKIRYDFKGPGNQGVLWIKSEGLLFETGYENKNIVADGLGENIHLFKNDGDCSFDIFSAVFYMLSRYEEYGTYEPDEYQRFRASQSISHKYQFLEYPVVDIWVRKLRAELLKKFPNLTLAEEDFSYQMTYDIDSFFKYKGRSFSNYLLALGKDLLLLKLRQLKERCLVLVGKQKDPWDVFDLLYEEGNDNVVEKSLFFILCGKLSRFDRNLARPDSSSVSKVLQKIKKDSSVGLHPSYYSSDEPSKIITEKKILENLLNKPVQQSRQHFLKFKMHSTFINLQQAGIEKEYSMGFAEAPGFRAGTSKPFFYYNLNKEKQEPLQIFPLCWMDATFVHYLKNDKEKALAKAFELIDRVKEVKGVFIPVFHNSYIGEEGFMSVHNEILRKLQSLTANG